MDRQITSIRIPLIAAAAIAAFPTAMALAGPVVPTFSASDFTPGAPIDNPFFPLTPGTTFRYEANVTDPDFSDKGFERDEDFVTSQTKTIAGVQARVVRARTWLDDLLVEDTLDYYAQDKSGNVWYLGEDTKAFEYDDNGKLTSTDTTGSFRAGVNGAKGGFIMPADPQVGFSYFQEVAPNDDALDQAEVLSRSESVTIPLGTFDNVLKTLETTELEPGVKENKFYAAGVGNILVFEAIGDDGVPLNTIPLVAVEHGSGGGGGGGAIPLPPAVWSALATALIGSGFLTLARKRPIK